MTMFHVFGKFDSNTYAEASLLAQDNMITLISSNESLPFIEDSDKTHVLVYPITYNTMCGTAKLWLEKNGSNLEGKDVMAIGIGGGARGTHAFELDFISIMAGVRANWSRKNALIVPGNIKDRERARAVISQFERKNYASNISD